MRKFLLVLFIQLLYWLIFPSFLAKSVFAAGQACCTNGFQYYDTCRGKVDFIPGCYSNFDTRTGKGGCLTGDFTNISCGVGEKCSSGVCQGDTKPASCPDSTSWNLTLKDKNGNQGCCTEHICWPIGDPSCPQQIDRCSDKEPICTDTFYSRFDPNLRACINPTGATSTWDLTYDCGDKDATGKYTGIGTAIGCIPVKDLTKFIAFILRFALGVSGGIIILMLIITGYTLLTSAGNPEKLQAVKENIVSIFSGLILIGFSLVLLQTIGASVLQLPTFIK